MLPIVFLIERKVSKLNAVAFNNIVNAVVNILQKAARNR